MGIKPFRDVPANALEWSRFLQDTEVVPTDGTITDETFANRAANSIIGRPSNTAGGPSDIVAGADNRFLTRRSNVIQFDALIDADIPASIARDSEVSAAVSAGIAAHEAASDPHPQYLLTAEADALYVALANVLTGSATYDPPSLGDAAGATTTVTVTGAALGDFALASFSLDLQGITVSAYVSGANTVSVRFQNESGGTLDLGSGTLRARVWKV